MLYLNIIGSINEILGKLFNFNKCCIWMTVVTIRVKLDDPFNFNKCCIWILLPQAPKFPLVKFNFNKCCIWMWHNKRYKRNNKHLTLTSVVFECIKFSSTKSTKFKFNFNKCCIWISALITTVQSWFLFNFNKCCIWMFSSKQKRQR